MTQPTHPFWKAGDKARVTVEIEGRRATYDTIVGPESTFGFAARYLCFHTHCMSFVIDSPCVVSAEKME